MVQKKLSRKKKTNIKSVQARKKTQSMEFSESDESDCEYFLQPSSQQYNITEKIKEANQSLYSKSEIVKQSQPKVRFLDQIDYEPKKEVEAMDKPEASNKKEDESSDDGYIDDETSSIVEDKKEVQESFEEVCEQIVIENEFTENDADDDSEKYSKEGFIDEPGLPEDTATSSSNDRPLKKKSYRPKSSKVVPQETVDSVRKLKTCCTHKDTDEYKQKLPSYSGRFNSKYGLSKDEIIKREFLQRKIQQYESTRRTQQLEKKEFLAKVNEEAFAKWLYKKMRNPMNNKSNPVNMFDIKASTAKTKKET